jgi:alginate O-acetyltransferase complex protein AlgI
LVRCRFPVFYGYWNPAYVGLLLASIFFNYGIGYALAREHDTDRNRRKNFILTAGIVVDLLLLGYYKYANFFLDTTNRILDTGWTLQDILLPLGISFFTFTQIAFLVDAWSGKAREYNFIHYLLFVTYFPTSDRRPGAAS